MGQKIDEIQKTQIAFYFLCPWKSHFMVCLHYKHS